MEGPPFVQLPRNGYCFFPRFGKRVGFPSLFTGAIQPLWTCPERKWHCGQPPGNPKPLLAEPDKAVYGFITIFFPMSLTLQKEIQMARDIAESARELLVATTDSAGEKVRMARARLGDALESSKDVFDRVSDRAATAARVADGQLRDHPYVPVFVALGLAALLAAVLLKGNPPKDR